jgi:uncharacterized protein YjbI with pentapeptide repeats
MNDEEFGKEIQELVQRITEAKTERFSELVEIAGLDLKKDLVGIDLSGEDLSGENLSSANLSSANLSNARLRGADLSGANLSGV